MIFDGIVEDFLLENYLDPEFERLEGNIVSIIENDEDKVVNKGNPDINDEIEPIVDMLEDKGYKVAYSSPGYLNTKFKNDTNGDNISYGKLVSTARIVFEKDYHFDNSPKGWDWKVTDGENKSLYVHPYTYSKKHGKPPIAFDKWKRFYLGNLMTWANELPDSKDAGKEGHRLPPDKDYTK